MPTTKRDLAAEDVQHARAMKELDEQVAAERSERSRIFAELQDELKNQRKPKCHN